MADTPANVYTAHAERSIQGEFVRALGSIGMGMLASNRALACTSACACTKRGASNDKTDVLLSHPPGSLLSVCLRPHTSTEGNIIKNALL